MKAAGFSLLEMLIAMVISAVMMISAGRFLPLLLSENLKLHQQVQLRQELLQIMLTLEKAVRRAGYCNGTCGSESLRLSENCLLVRWDENSNGKWEAVTHSESDYYGYRLRQNQLEMQRGVEACDGKGWERLSDPAFLKIAAFNVVREGALIKLLIQGQAGPWLETLESWVEGENL
ncbi:prepilin peptidase-dependent protein [Pantoea sp. LMR881]|uniref:prepilin peptidase-dependent protein n=1 Tax=Pantoea sp. LMR881 TaxID=3014336 RepID=UPI0022AE6F8D|nr:prepilin peptidase-dependent protein [Pantoea sp. LMR881]MCZ4060318.1 prepilin peptidase-dependent protein [Pantoea sp. LMR881]